MEKLKITQYHLFGDFLEFRNEVHVPGALQRCVHRIWRGLKICDFIKIIAHNLPNAFMKISHTQRRDGASF